MHPILKADVSLGCFQIAGSDTTHYFVETANEEYEISYRLWKALDQVDGTRPLNVSDDVLASLKEHGIIQTSRLVKDDDSVLNRFILFPFRNDKERSSFFSRAINSALPYASILVLAIGICLFHVGTVDMGRSFSGPLFLGLALLSLAMHEVGHLMAASAYNYNVTSLGLLLLGRIPVGAYIAHTEKPDTTPAERIQVALAGIEVNFLIAGIFFIAAVNSPFSITLVSIAVYNIASAFANLLPTAGLDGEVALSAVLEVERISITAKQVLLNRAHRRKLFHSGVPGIICFCLLSVSLVSKYILYLIIIMEASFALKIMFQ